MPTPLCDYTETMPSIAKSSRVNRLPGKPTPRLWPRAKIAAAWSMRTVQGMQVVEVASFKRLPWLVPGLSTRTGGTSPVDSGERILNLGFTEWDRRENVHRNRQAFQSAVGAGDSTLVILKQFHSPITLFFAAPPEEPRKGDASVTNSRGILLGVQTADCVPILLVDVKKRAIAAVHAGWRGTLARIAEKTVGEMHMHFDSNPADIFAALGPAIGGCFFCVEPPIVPD